MHITTYTAGGYKIATLEVENINELRTLMLVFFQYPMKTYYELAGALSYEELPEEFLEKYPLNVAERIF